MIKRFGMWSLVGVLAVAGALLFGEAMAQSRVTPAAPTRVAVCDVVQVFNNNQKSKDLQAMLDEKRQELEAEDQRRQQEIQNVAMELNAYKEGSEQYEQTLERVQRLRLERKNWAEFQQALIAREYQRFTREMYQEIVGVIEAVSRQRGVDMVLFYEKEMQFDEDPRNLVNVIQRRKVLYAADSVNLTDEVLAELNSAYQAASGQ